MLKTRAVKCPDAWDKKTRSLQSEKLQKLKTEAKKTAIKNQEHFTLCTPYNVDSKSHMSVKQEIHPKAFRLTLFRGYRQNEVEILPNWFIYRKEEISLVNAVANKKGFRR